MKKAECFFYTSILHEDLISRKMELSDNVIPASNSVMAKNLFLLGKYFYDENYLVLAKQMLSNIKQDMISHPAYYSNWASLALWLLHDPFEIAIVGEDAEKLNREFNKNFLPHALLLGGNNEGNLPLLKNKLLEGETLIYVCQNKTCKLPARTVEHALQQMK